eukprot:9246604-Ditylum_brightwellii.AAC.1
MSCSWMNNSCTCSAYGINWAGKQLATQPGNCFCSSNTLLDRYAGGHSDKIIDACMCWQKPSKQPQPL